MNQELMTEQLFHALITGERNTARAVLTEASKSMRSEDIAHDILWPTLEMINQLFRADQMTSLAHHYGMRLLRTLMDQNQLNFSQKKRRGRKVLLFCGHAEADELAGLLVADLVEASGYDVLFGGGGVANDEILPEVGEQRPDILLMFASSPSDAPNIRQLIDTVREIAACPDLQIAVGGGVFNRAEGLAEEIGADIWATTPREMLERLNEQPTRRATAEQRTVGRSRRSAVA